MKDSSLRKASFICGIALLFVLEAFAVAASVRHAMLDGPRLSPSAQSAVRRLAELPSVAWRLLSREWPFGVPSILLLQNIDLAQLHNTESAPDSTENGYLLFSGVRPFARQSTIQLVRLGDDSVLWTWTPNFDVIGRVHLASPFETIDARRASQAIAPHLLSDGSVIFNTWSRLVNLDICGRLRWVGREVVHHSVEIDAAGAIWAPSVSPSYFARFGAEPATIREDAIAKFRGDGVLLWKRSLAQILADNGLRGLLWGREFSSNADPFHVNDVQPALSTSKYWRAGDLLISARNLSTVFLYRPASGKILWMRTGPWVNQHDVAFLDNYRISVFGNDVGSFSRRQHFLNDSGLNSLYIYDFATDSIFQPFEQAFQLAQIRTPTQGRALVLDNSNVFVEETDRGRFLRLTKDRVLWSKVNWYDSTHVGSVGWSRYLRPDEVSGFLALAKNTRCERSAAH